MQDAIFQPTAYTEVNAALELLLTGARDVLGDHFVGMLLYGSLASGDFNPATSDIDFVVVTDGELPAEIVSALEAMHARIASSGLAWAARLEGAYIPRRDLRRYDPAGGPYPMLNEGRFYVDRHGSDWVIQRHIMREHGVCLAGPPPVALIDPVGADELRRAVAGILGEWWAWHLDDTHRLQEPGYQAFTVLTMCRALYTLEHGAVVSKPVSARWAQTALGEPRASLIGQALGWGHGDPFDHLGETLDLIRYTVKRSRALTARLG